MAALLTLRLRGNIQMKVEHRMLNVEHVEFDPGNPRIAEYLNTYTEPSPETVAMALQPGDAKYQELKQAIKSNEGIINPIIVNSNDSRLIAIEGNTRLAIVKQFHSQYPDTETWSRIPAVVYENMSQTAIDAVRLQAHLVGVRNWTPYAKAKYLYSLHEGEYLPTNDLIDFCGGNKLEVIRNIEAFRQMEFTYRPMLPDDNFDQHKFSNFFEAQKPTIRKALTKSSYSDKNFAEWVKDGKFEPRQELVRLLPAILSNPRSKQVFLEYGAEKAQEFINRPEISKELQSASLVELCTAIQEKIQNLTLRERDNIRNDDVNAQCVDDTAAHLANFYINEIQNT